MAKARYAACMACRSDAQKVVGVTANQRAGLALGQEKGTNHRTGYSHREESKRQTARKNKQYWLEHPDQAMSRGAKIRAGNHYKWKGGVTKLNKSIRTMTENRKWMKAVKDRDGSCVRCNETEKLESHHIRPLSKLIESFEIKSNEDARNHAAVLWNIENGITLCESCHYAEHGRTLDAH